MKKVTRAKRLPARDRMQRLLEQAGQNPERAKRYVALARRIGMRRRLRLPTFWRRKICKQCNAFLIPGRNCRVRTHEGKVVYRCLDCNNITRYPYKRKK